MSHPATFLRSTARSLPSSPRWFVGYLALTSRRRAHTALRRVVALDGLTSPSPTSSWRPLVNPEKIGIFTCLPHTRAACNNPIGSAASATRKELHVGPALRLPLAVFERDNLGR